MQVTNVPKLFNYLSNTAPVQFRIMAKISFSFLTIIFYEKKNVDMNFEREIDFILYEGQLV